MRKSVSEFGRFQISLATFSGGGTTVGLARSVIAETCFGRQHGFSADIRQEK